MSVLHHCSYIIPTLYRYVVGIVFGFEHALLLLALWLQWVIAPVPKWVRIAIARRDYLAGRREEADKTKQE